MPCSASEVTSEAASEIQKAYDSYAPSYDELDAGELSQALGFPQLRQELLAKARGSVLEVAVGTGLNLRYYAWPALSSLTALDISQGMLDQAKARVQAQLPGKPITFQQGDVAALPFEPSSFDCVVDTFSLCVFPDPQAALKEMARVVKPADQGGRVLLVEHSRSSNPLLGAYQDLTAPAVASSSKGCVWNQDLRALLAGAGLQALSLREEVGGTVTILEAARRA